VIAQCFLSLLRLCRNTRNHLDVMLSASEASVFPIPYEKQILRRRLRMTLRHGLSGIEVRALEPKNTLTLALSRKAGEGIKTIQKEKQVYE
jgi:hypothetical protein